MRPLGPGRLPGRRRAGRWPSALGRPPREVAQAVIGRGRPRPAICRDVEVAGPGFINLDVRRRLPRPERSRRWPPSDRLGVAADAGARDRRRRLLAPERRQGDARRPPAHDDHRRRLGAPAGGPRPHASSGRTTSATGGRRSGCSSSTCSTSASDEAAEELSVGDLNGFYQAGPQEVRRRRRLRGAVARSGSSCCRAATPRRCACGHVLVDESSRYFQAVYDRLGVAARTRRPRRREHLQRPCSPSVVERARRQGPAGRQRRRAAASSRRASRTATASRCPLIVRRAGRRLRLRRHRPRRRSATALERCSATRLLYVVGRAAAQTPRDGVRRRRGWRAGCAARREPSTSASAPCSGADQKMLQDPQPARRSS